MDHKKRKKYLEIVYNCPFILLVLFTSFIAMFLSDEIGVHANGKNIAVSRMEKAAQEEAEEAENEEDKNVNKIKKEQYTKNENEAERPDSPQEKGTGTENAGIRKEDITQKENENERKDDLTKLENDVNKGKEREKTTRFEEYTPIEVDSRYYSDAGKIALTTDYDYTLENESYFNDAVFLGDSRTLGISDYAGLDGADFFCENGMTIYKVLEDAGVTYQKTGEKVDLKQIFQEKQYGKIYIMLGMNELGYGDTSMYIRQYRKVTRQIRVWQPEATIYIMANLHVSREKNDMESEFNNVNINDKNVASARLASGKNIFYLDCNPLFTDEEGYLQAELTFDGVHLYAQHYDKWREFLFAHGVERTEEDF